MLVRSSLRPIAAGLMLAAPLAGAAVAAVPPETVILYATHIVPNSAWTNESYAAGDPGNLDCNGVPSQYCTTSTPSVWLVADQFQNAPSMTGFDITSIKCEALCRYDAGSNLTVEAGFNLGSGFGSTVSDRWTSDPDNCSWRLASAGNVSTSANINNIQIRVRMASGVSNNELRIKAFRIIITRVEHDCDNDGVGDNSDLRKAPIVSPLFMTPPSGLMCPGGSISITAPVQSDAPVTYNWYHNGILLPFHTPTITLPNLAASDAGWYQCQPVNSCGNAYSNSVSVIVCPVDFDFSGALNVQDIFAFINAWFARDPRTDFNHDGVIDVRDIFDFLNAWFAGCP